MPRGGKRPGAGRKKGSGTKKTRKTNQIAEKAAGEGVLPLQVLLEAMRSHYGADPPRLDEAARIAVAAAPYVHSRLSQTTHKGGLRVIHGVEDLTDEELDAIAGAE